MSEQEPLEVEDFYDYLDWLDAGELDDGSETEVEGD